MSFNPKLSLTLFRSSSLALKKWWHRLRTNKFERFSFKHLEVSEQTELRLHNFYAVFKTTMATLKQNKRTICKGPTCLHSFYSYRFCFWPFRISLNVYWNNLAWFTIDTNKQTDRKLVLLAGTTVFLWALPLKEMNWPQHATHPLFIGVTW